MSVLIVNPPVPIGKILRWPGTSFLARLALVGAYIQGGVVKLAGFPDAVAEQVHFGMHPPVFWAMLTIIVELTGAVLLLTNRWRWLGAGMLGVFTFLAALVANAFWAMPIGPERAMAMNAFFEHIGLIGGFVLAAAMGEAKDARHA